MLIKNAPIRTQVRSLSLACLLMATGAQAASFNTIEDLGQDNFKLFSENVAASIQYKGITPAEPLGLIGFDIGASLSYTSIDKDLFDIASAGDFDVDGLILPRISVHKGLPFGMDVGASYTGAPGTDIKVLGAEIRYALMEGGVASPAVGLRASYSVLQGVDELDMNNMGVDISISKGFLVLTPYAGAGLIRTTATPRGIVDGAVTEVDFTQQKLFVGVNINLGVNMTLEADKTGDHTSYNVKAGIRF